MSDIVSRIRNSIPPNFDSRTYSEDLAWEAADAIEDRNAEIDELQRSLSECSEALSVLKEQAVRACMWLNTDGSPADGPRFREEQAKLRAMLGPDQWWNPDSTATEGGAE